MARQPTTSTGSSGSSSGSVVSNIAPSVHYLATTFMEEVLSTKKKKRTTFSTFFSAKQQQCLTRESTMHDIIEDWNNNSNQPGLLRTKGWNQICCNGIDGSPMVGAAAAAAHDVDGILHAAAGAADNVGDATHMLSYSWTYAIGDIVDALVDFCDSNGLDPKRTYIWMDCFCVNQHPRKHDGPPRSGAGGLEAFETRVASIGHVLAMIAPWQNPDCLQRIWCLFELYTAIMKECHVTVVMPRREKEALLSDIIGKTGGVEALFDILGDTKIQHAQASCEMDRTAILDIVRASPGYYAFNHAVSDILRIWVRNAIDEITSHHQTNNNLKDEEAASLFNNIGLLLQSQGNYDGALVEYKKSLVVEEAIRESVFGEDSPTSATTHSNIGSVFFEQGDNVGALVEDRKCLAIRESVLGEIHPSTAESHNNIGIALQQQGDFTGALVEYQHCLAIREPVFGRDHPSTAEAHNDIGGVLKMLGNYDGALLEYKQCLAIHEAIFGENHPATASSHNDIGSALYEQEDYCSALVELEKCLAIRISVFGRDHPMTAASYSNIGSVYQAQGDYASALVEYRQCLAIQESVLGKEHPSTATTHSNIGECLGSPG